MSPLFSLGSFLVIHCAQLVDGESASLQLLEAHKRGWEDSDIRLARLGPNGSLLGSRGQKVVCVRMRAHIA